MPDGPMPDEPVWNDAAYPEDVAYPEEAEWPVDPPAPTTVPVPEQAVMRRADRSSSAALRDIAGVRSGDGSAERHRIVRDRPRLRFTSAHALMAILLLTAALCASLTMLLQQSLRYESALAETRARTQAGGTGSSGIDDEQPGSQGQAAETTQEGTKGGDDAASATAGGGEDGGTDAADGADAADAVDGGGVSEPSDGGSSSAGSPSAVDDGLIDINTATSEELQTIKGIGPVTADRIIAYRTQIGRFSNVDQLLEVKGIGAKTLAKIREQVTVR
ncbi:helix-hairpin-helix domain-containing protein [Bifidobacterium amazonense]|uniref:Helix-hairpin-helix domain-containing protein n=1 Tax=Bifidobacterium amazonense TaxID=2809027 RepID=A0ABS9VY36_9BIFI|nr:helix-hairpin-helix domain-containing protein [Bifidobacterium amazonense]MCH9277017.1 helix-hairpin-helix domain-containing protein [Bifidobacterium amazonense]